MMHCKWLRIAAVILTLSACATADRQQEAGLEQQTENAAADTEARPDPLVPPAPEVGERPIAAPPDKALPVPVREEKAGPVQAMVRLDAENNVYFAAGETLVDEIGRSGLKQHARRLKNDPRVVVTLVGYADPSGSRSYNLALAEGRMNAVFNILRTFGVSKRQIRRIYAGQTAPAVTCPSPECRQATRRVELIYKK